MPQIFILRPDLGPLSPQISPPCLKFGSPGLKSALQTSNQQSRHQISPPGLKSALQTSNQHSRPQINPTGLKSALNTSSLPQDLKSNLQAQNFPPRPQITLRTSGNYPLCPTGHRPFGAAAQKAWSDDSGSKTRQRRSHRGVQDAQRTHKDQPRDVLGSA